MRRGPFKRRAQSRFPILHEADYGLSFAATSSQLIRRISLCGDRHQPGPEQQSIMDFNVKKLASDAGVFFTRAVQVHLTHITCGTSLCFTEQPDGDEEEEEEEGYG